MSAALSSSSNDPTSRVPLLGGTTGSAYPQWRPAMQTYLIRQNIGGGDYAVEIPHSSKAVELVTTEEETERQAAFALLFGVPTTQIKVDEPVTVASSRRAKREPVAVTVDHKP